MRNLRRLLAACFVIALLSTSASPAGSITRGGELDGDEHPYVALMVATDGAGNPMWRCSGAFIDAYTYVTAGHCTSGAAGAQIWLATDVESGIPGNGYPFTGDAAGVAHTHPLYFDPAFYLYDLGVVKMTTPVALPRYASLPTVGQVDDLGNGRNDAVVTAVGYGLQRINPVFVEAERVRYQADLFVVDTNGAAGIGNLQLPSDQPPTNSMILSGDAKHGGTCFGDSGGPALDGDTILGVTSFGLNGNCAGIGGSFRIDRQYELDWINGLPNP